MQQVADVRCTDEPAEGYRPCAGALVINDAGLIFTGRRIDSRTAAWQMPQGGIDHGEQPFDAAKRELLEETGIERVEPLAETRGWLAYDLPPDVAARKWRGRYRGQTQKWFAMRFTGDDSEIDINVKHAEFDEWRWLEAAEMIRLIVPFKQGVYRRVVEEFRHLLA